MYPWVVVFRDQKYSYLDWVFKNEPKATYLITEQIELLFNEHWNVLITIGDSWTEYSIQFRFIDKIYKKWLHFVPKDVTPQIVNQRVLTCYIANLPKRIDFRPRISAFTTSYKSAHKILRPFRSLMSQTFKDWEWVIIDDTEGDENWKYIRENLKDPRIRIYKRNGNSGSIGNVKNEASSLCRGQFLLELDHDDDLMSDCLATINKGFESPEVGFVYMDFAELYEDWKPFHYCDGWGPGRYGTYYRQYVELYGNKAWLYVARSCEINSITMTDITGVPNHPRVWRKSVLEDIGGYSEAMPIADDYELLVRTCLQTKMMYIRKLGYLQYKNEGANNFSLIRNGEIQKIQKAVSEYYKDKLQDFFKIKAQYGPEIWRKTDWIDSKVNLISQYDFDMTVLITSIENLLSEKVRELYGKTDMIIVLNSDDGIQILLETLGYYKIKYHILEGASSNEILNYFYRCYLVTKDFIII